MTTAHLAIFYRNFQSKGGQAYKHVGLGVNAMHTAKTLQQHGYNVTVHGIWDGNDIARELKKMPDVTHALIEAPFIGGPDMLPLIKKFPRVKFACRTHSQIGFLQVEAGAIRLIREYISLQSAELNFIVATNSDRLAAVLRGVYNANPIFLPNLYAIDQTLNRRRPLGPTLRISSFGAIRLLKNHTTAAAAAMLIAASMGKDLEFYINSDREEHGKGVVDALKNMFTGLTWAKLVEVPWQDWPEFRNTVASMDLCLQPSFTETFCLVLADAASHCIPCIGSPAITWLPKRCQVNPDSAADIAMAGSRELLDPASGTRAYRALAKHVKGAIGPWRDFLATDATGATIRGGSLPWYVRWFRKGT